MLAVTKLPIQLDFMLRTLQNTDLARLITTFSPAIFALGQANLARTLDGTLRHVTSVHYCHVYYVRIWTNLFPAMVERFINKFWKYFIGGFFNWRPLSTFRWSLVAELPDVTPPYAIPVLDTVVKPWNEWALVS